MFSVFMEMLSYPFLAKAIVVGLLVSLCASLLGVSLVLKRYSMIGDGLSHVGFGTMSIAAAINSVQNVIQLDTLAFSIPIVILAAFGLLRISESSKIKGDAAIALISTSSLAIGVIAVSLTTGLTTDVCNAMFGTILAMSNSDVYLSVTLSIIVLILFAYFYNKIFAVTFDETFAKATGTKAGIFNMLIAFLTAVTIVLGMRMMGALLISSLIIFPSLTAMRVCKKFRSVVISAAIISVFCFITGITLSFIFEFPTGASVVAVNIVLFIIFSIIGFIRG